MYVDKRFSLSLTQSEVNIAKNLIRGLLAKKERLERSLQPHSAEGDGGSRQPHSADEGNLSEEDDFEAYMESLHGLSAPPPSAATATQLATTGALENEFTQLEALRRLPANTVIKEFWSSIDGFPVIKSIAFDLIAVPMTEVSAERLFSHLNFILNKNRSCLNDKILDDILLLRMNAKFK